jgi:hypothetical protein
MQALLVGEAEAVTELADRLAQRGAGADVIALQAGTERSVQALADALTDLEARAAASPADLAVALGAGDQQLSLALVATKAGIPLVACLVDDNEPESRILAELADQVFPPPEDDAGWEALAEQLSTWSE